MNAQRKGSGLKVEIRMALSYLGRDTDINLNGKSIEELAALKAQLHAEVRAKQTATVSEEI